LRESNGDEPAEPGDAAERSTSEELAAKAEEMSGQAEQLLQLM